MLNKQDWGSVDWTKENNVIADEMGVSVQAVFYQRKKHTGCKSRK